MRPCKETLGGIIMDVSLLSLTDKQAYAVSNIMQSLENAKMYCSYLDNADLRYRLVGMVERFIRRTEKEINSNF